MGGGFWGRFWGLRAGPAPARPPAPPRGDPGGSRGVPGGSPVPPSLGRPPPAPPAPPLLRHGPAAAAAARSGRSGSGPGGPRPPPGAAGDPRDPPAAGAPGCDGGHRGGVAPPEPPEAPPDRGRAGCAGALDRRAALPGHRQEVQSRLPAGGRRPPGLFDPIRGQFPIFRSLEGHQPRGRARGRPLVLRLRREFPKSRKFPGAVREVRPRIPPALPRAPAPRRRRALELPPLRLRRGHQAGRGAAPGPAGAGDAADEVGAAVRARGAGLGPAAPAQPPALLLLLRRARPLEPEDAAVPPLPAVVPRGLHAVPEAPAALRRPVLHLRVQRVPGRGRERAEAAPALGGRGSPAALPPQRPLPPQIFRPGAGNSALRQRQLGRAAARPARGHAALRALRAAPGGAEHPQGQNPAVPPIPQVRVGPGDEEAQGALRAAQPRPSPTAPRAAAGPPLPHPAPRPRPQPRAQPLPRAGQGRGPAAPPPPALPGLPWRLLQLPAQRGPGSAQLSHAGPGPCPFPPAPPAPPRPGRGPAPRPGPAQLGPAPRPGPAPPGFGAPGDAGRDRAVPAGVGGAAL
ncbi:PHD finger protein 1 isoform X7 [Vidua chalybeata]|uniref:PHD finger protein 1 isoform X7 n=1 Tax=Vidua chalybeata TaxID=81927 RepID=UPI0023A823F0|nr:PHD finger protein 1 isoform X7 [Vidua chalybeata]